MARIWRQNDVDRSRPQPGGMTLIELLGGMAVTGLLLSIAVTLLAATLHLDRVSAGSTAEHSELQRLSEYLRQDAHRAIDLELTEDGQSWSFVLPGDGRVDYQMLDHAVRRVERIGRTEKGEAAAARQQALSLPSGAAVKVREAALAGSRFVQLLITTGQDRTGSPATILNVEAELRGSR